MICEQIVHERSNVSSGAEAQLCPMRGRAACDGPASVRSEVAGNRGDRGDRGAGGGRNPSEAGGATDSRVEAARPWPSIWPIPHDGERSGSNVSVRTPAACLVGGPSIESRVLDSGPGGAGWDRLIQHDAARGVLRGPLRMLAGGVRAGRTVLGPPTKVLGLEHLSGLGACNQLLIHGGFRQHRGKVSEPTQWRGRSKAAQNGESVEWNREMRVRSKAAQNGESVEWNREMR
eukprot:1182556-Prorocentrum_minimum.AAC.2